MADRVKSGVLIGSAILACALAAAVFLAAGAKPAEAAFPGENGKIAYEYHEILGWEWDSPETAPSDIFLANPDGSSNFNLTATARRSEYDPAVSPLGKRVAFTGCPTNGSCGVYTVRTDGTYQKRIAAGASPAWSPDGKKLAFMREGDVWTMGAGGGNQKNLTSSGGTYEGSPAWSPGGGKIAFVRDGDVWKMTPDGAREKNLSGSFREDNFSNAGAPSFSPDGKRIVFDASVQIGGLGGCSYRNIFTMGARGSAWTQLTRGEDYHDCADNSPTPYSGEAAYSPDGKKLAYATGHYYSNVAVMDSDGSDGARLDLDTGETENGALTTSPDWGPARSTP